MTNQPQHQWSKFYLKDVTFANLMMRRIYNILIVANPYDAFMLEDDGRIGTHEFSHNIHHKPFILIHRLFLIVILHSPYLVLIESREQFLFNMQ